MKHKILIAIYIICILSIVGAVETIFTSDSTLEKTFAGISGFLSAFIFGGLWTRNEIARKIAIYYFGIHIIIGVLGFIMIVFVIIGGEYALGLLGLLIVSATIALYIFIIRGLNSPKLLDEFN